MKSSFFWSSVLGGWELPCSSWPRPRPELEQLQARAGSLGGMSPAAGAAPLCPGWAAWARPWARLPSAWGGQSEPSRDAAPLCLGWAAWVRLWAPLPSAQGGQREPSRDAAPLCPGWVVWALPWRGSSVPGVGGVSPSLQAQAVCLCSWRKQGGLLKPHLILFMEYCFWTKVMFLLLSPLK